MSDILLRQTFSKSQQRYRRAWKSQRMSQRPKNPPICTATWPVVSPATESSPQPARSAAAPPAVPPEDALPAGTGCSRPQAEAAPGGCGRSGPLGRGPLKVRRGAEGSGGAEPLVAPPHEAVGYSTVWPLISEALRVLPGAGCWPGRQPARASGREGAEARLLAARPELRQRSSDAPPRTLASAGWTRSQSSRALGLPPSGARAATADSAGGKRADWTGGWPPTAEPGRTPEKRQCGAPAPRG